jgi:hypothetical protein
MRQRSAAIFIAATATLCATLLTGAGAGAAVVLASAGARAGTRGGQLPGAAALRPAQVNAVSCVSAGDCTAGGYFLDSSSHRHAFVVTEKNGIWGKPEKVRSGLARLDMGGGAGINSVSCPSVGNCTAAGTYDAVSTLEQSPQAGPRLRRTKGSRCSAGAASAVTDMGG